MGLNKSPIHGAPIIATIIIDIPPIILQFRKDLYYDLEINTMTVEYRKSSIKPINATGQRFKQPLDIIKVFIQFFQDMSKYQHLPVVQLGNEAIN